MDGLWYILIILKTIISWFLPSFHEIYSISVAQKMTRISYHYFWRLMRTKNHPISVKWRPSTNLLQASVPWSNSSGLTELLWVSTSYASKVQFFTRSLNHLFKNQIYSGPQSDSHVSLHMNILDGVFIRKHHRRKGWATSMLQDILNSFPDQDIGLSHPISHSLHSGIFKFNFSSLNNIYLFI